MATAVSIMVAYAVASVSFGVMVGKAIARRAGGG
jgi:hypothetical protein